MSDGLLSKLDSLSELAENFDLAALMPNIPNMLQSIVGICGFAVLIGPLLLLGLGLSYYFLAPKEANYYFGYRCYFGMGSPRAWQYTQHLAGLVMGSLGAVLTLIMVIMCIRFAFMDSADVVWAAFICMIAEVILTLGAVLFINIWTMNCFDANGKVRKKNA